MTSQLFAKVILGLIVVMMSTYILGRNSNKISAYKKILLGLFVLSVILAIFYPNVVGEIAHFIGIGRGADLIFYLTTIVLIFVIVNSSFQRKEEQKKIVKLARRITLLEKRIEGVNQHGRKKR